MKYSYFMQVCQSFVKRTTVFIVDQISTEIPASTNFIIYIY